MVKRKGAHCHTTSSSFTCWRVAGKCCGQTEEAMLCRSTDGCRRGNRIEANHGVFLGTYKTHLREEKKNTVKIKCKEKKRNVDGTWMVSHTSQPAILLLRASSDAWKCLTWRLKYHITAQRFQDLPPNPAFLKDHAFYMNMFRWIKEGFREVLKSRKGDTHDKKIHENKNSFPNPSVSYYVFFYILEQHRGLSPST